MADPPASAGASAEAAFAPKTVETALDVEVDFTLPQGYRDASETVHRDGRMRLATARDELAPLVDPRVARNRAYLVVLLLARVVTRLGSVPVVTPEVIEGLYATDFSYLQRLYRRLNLDPLEAHPTCPHCGEPLPPEVAGTGGSVGRPSQVTVEEVAALAKGLGWSYEALMSMSGSERRLWLAAADRVAPPPPTVTGGPLRVPALTTTDGPPSMTDAQRRARLLALHDELNHRGH